MFNHVERTCVYTDVHTCDEMTVCDKYKHIEGLCVIVIVFVIYIDTTGKISLMIVVNLHATTDLDGIYSKMFRPLRCWHIVEFVLLLRALSVMEPLASVAQLRLNMKPERDNFTIPKVLADVVLEEIVIALGKNQVRGSFGLFWFTLLFSV